jgi:uncharacterized protein YndB with AHSA1/START domain
VVRIELTIDVARRAEEVFEHLIDLDRLPEWQASAVESRADEPLARGVHIFECRRVLGKDVHNELEVTAFDPPRRLTLDHRLAEADGSTRLEVVAEGRAGRFMKLGEPVLKRQAEQELRGDFTRLKELLEA